MKETIDPAKKRFVPMANRDNRNLLHCWKSQNRLRLITVGPTPLSYDSLTLFISSLELLVLNRFLCLCLLALIPLETGCRNSGDRFKLPVVPASGTLTIPGMKTADLALSFIPDDQTLTNAWSIVSADGTFHVSTYEPGDGIAVGTYTVIISGGVGVMPDDDNRLEKIAPQYRNAGNSPWKIEIAPDPDRNVLNFVAK